MSDSPRDLIDGYFDDVLTPEQHAALSEWIKSDPQHARIFAQQALLHDQLRSLHSSFIDSSFKDSSAVVTRAAPTSPLYRRLSRTSMWSAASVAIIGVGLLWFTFSQSTASAAIGELNRIIVQNMDSKDRTYEIVVEEVYPPEPRGKHPPLRESSRPPKPPLDGAVLHVGETNQFVLIRKTVDGLPFITGSNGRQSWAINTRGSVRVSSDIHHFDHDLPGHENSIPLTNLHDGLERLRQAYHVELSTVGPEEFESQAGETVRMLVAIKKPRERGPQRVEIAYESQTGRILHMRFVQMPYGPDRLDLRLSLLNEDDLPPELFEHASHHTPDRKVETEN
jgi:hypothetical protein